MLKRKRILSSVTESPSMKVSYYFSGFILKLVYCIIVAAVIFVAFNYFIFELVNFLLVNVAVSGEISKNNPYFAGAEIFVIILSIYIIFRDRLRKR